MRAYLNLKDQTFGSLQALELTEKKEGTTRLWKCMCTCGNITYKKASRLLEARKIGFNLSCGCSKGKENLIGKTFNDFKVIEHVQDLNNSNTLWDCICTNCGKEFTRTTKQLRKNQNICELKLKYSATVKHVLYSSLSRIKNRCYNIKCDNYKYYGGRGITVCDEWLQDSSKFVEWSLRNGYKYNENKYTIDRIDNNKGYTPDNCRWVSIQDQANNKRNNIKYTYNGVTQTLAQWCRELNLNYKYVHYLIKVKNKNFKDAITYKKRG